MLKEFNFINLFRAIAAFWVLSAHCMIWGGWHGYILNPKIAVDLFMIISGFLMTANASARDNDEPLTDLRSCLKFWLRRFFRIAPSYYLSLAIAILLSDSFLTGYQQLQHLNPAQWPDGGVYDPSRIKYTLENIALHISFIFGLHPTYSFSTFLPDWSLSLEMQFYIAFPLILLITKKLGELKTATLIGIPIFFIGLISYKLVHYYEPSLLIFKLNYFLAGIILFHTLIAKNKRILLFLCSILLVSIDYRYHYQIIILPILLVSMTMLGWLEANHRTPRTLTIIMNNKIMKFLSNTSYGIYLFHGFFISLSGIIITKSQFLIALSPAYRVIFMLFFVTTISYPFAYIIYKAIELPGIYIGRKIITRLSSIPRVLPEKQT